MLNSKVTRRWFLSALVGLAAAPALLKLAPKATAPAVEGSTQGFGYGLLAKGDVFTIEGVYALNPLTYRRTGQLKQFVVTSDVAADQTLIGYEQIHPQLITAGPYANVDIPIDWEMRSGFGVIPRSMVRVSDYRADLVIGGYAGPPMGARILS